jgi:hypothetical protein
MVIDKDGIKLHKITYKLFAILLSFGFLFPESALAFDWRIRPNLSMSEVFSDNLALSNNAKKSGFVSEVSPGISMYGSSPWSNLNLNYRLQGLYNAGGSDAIDINHQLQMSSLYQALRNTLFLQTSSSISQQNISNTFITTDNLTGNGSRVESKNFNISPYWTPHFGQYANGLLKVGYQKSSFDNANSNTTSSPLLSQISDSETFSRQARLSSGSKFNTMRWNLNYSSQDQSRVSGSDVRFEHYTGDARYYFNRKYNVFVHAGYENNDFQTSSNSINNGFFYTFGAQWNPSQFYSLEAGYGNNKHVTIRVNPSANLSAFVTYQNKDIGLNTGNTWNANLNYRVKQAAVNFTYSQDTTTVQQVLADQQIFSDPTGGAVSGDTDQQLLVLNSNLPNLGLGNDVIISKNAKLSFTFQTGKSFYNASFYNTHRNYEPSLVQDDVYGASASWRWQFDPRLNFYLRPNWQSTDSGGASSVNSKRYDVALGVTRGVPINLGRPLLMNTSLELRHINQQSDFSLNDYTENRATANFAVRF